jgi:putative transcriptional regulator
MHASGIMPNAAYAKITMRHLGETVTTPVTVKLSPEEIRALRVAANLSQAVFAHFLNLTVGYVSQLERGEKRPTGAALALLNVIKRKGIEALL